MNQPSELLHVTANTGHCAITPRSDVAGIVIDALLPLLGCGMRTLPGGMRLRMDCERKSCGRWRIRIFGSDPVELVEAEVFLLYGHAAVVVHANLPAIVAWGGDPGILADLERCVAWACIEREEHT